MTIVMDEARKKAADKFADMVLRTVYAAALIDEGRLATLVTGSTIYNGFGNDIDIVLGPANDTVLDEDDLSGMHGALVDLLTCEPSGEYGILDDEAGAKGYRMHCYRRGEYNIIMVDRGLERWRQALEVCTVLTAVLPKPITKRQRVAVHKVLVDNFNADLTVALTMQQVPDDYT